MSGALLPVAILAGGLATRLRPLTEKIPKSLLDVAGEPFITHQLRLLRGQDAGRVVICAGFRGEMIQDLVGDGRKFGLHVEYSFDGPKLLGTAGAIKKALGLLGGKFFTLYGDSYLTCNFAAVQRDFEAGGRRALMTVFKNQGQWDDSNVELAGGRVLAYDKKNRTERMRHIDYGLGVFSAEAFAWVPAAEPTDLEQVYQQALREGELAACAVKERFYEIGSPDGLDTLRKLLLRES